MSKGTSSKILEEIKRIEDVPGFVYLIRNKDLYKIGITISMKRRVKELKPDEVVAVKEAANMRGIEKLLHKRYKDRRIPQTEYFRLTPEEVDEASYLLGAGDLSEDDTQSVTDKETEKATKKSYLQQEASRIDDVGKKKPAKNVLSPAAKERLEELEEWVFDTMGMEAMWKKGPITENGEVIDHQNFFDYIRIHGNDDPDIEAAPSVAVFEAVERCAVRQDLFLRVARSETSEEALRATEAVYLDLCLILLWGVGSKNIQMQAADSGSLSEMLKTFEDFVESRGYWWTDHADRQPRKPFKFKKPNGFYTALFFVVVGFGFSPVAGGVFLALLALWCVLNQGGN